MFTLKIAAAVIAMLITLAGGAYALMQEQHEQEMLEKFGEEAFHAEDRRIKAGTIKTPW